MLFFSACNNKETKKERWPGAWQMDNNKEISTTLTENKVLLCKEYRYKVPAKTGEAHLVRCTPDYKEWSTYMVWIQLNKVLGPYKTDPKMD